MEGPPLGPGGEDITWPDQVAPRGRKTSSTCKIKPQTSNLDALIGESSEVLAKEAFQRMDVQLDLSMRTAGILEG